MLSAEWNREGEGLAALAAAPFDGVITDARMPGMSGVDFVREVRRHYPALVGRIIPTSGDMACETIRRLLETTGCIGLEKPFSLHTLRALLADVTGRLAPGPTAPRNATA